MPPAIEDLAIPDSEEERRRRKELGLHILKAVGAFLFCVASAGVLFLLGSNREAVVRNRQIGVEEHKRTQLIACQLIDDNDLQRSMLTSQICADVMQWWRDHPESP